MQGPFKRKSQDQRKDTNESVHSFTRAGLPDVINKAPQSNVK